MKIKGNEPINPFLKWNEAGYGDAITIYDNEGGKQILPYESGITIRQYYAGLAMQGILEAGSFMNEQVAKLAVQQADNLIEELNKSEKW